MNEMESVQPAVEVSQPKMPGYLNEVELAKRLHRRPKTLWIWRNQGRGPTPTIVSRRVFSIVNGTSLTG